MNEIIKPAESDYDWLADAIMRRPTKRRNLTIPEHAETTTIPSGKYRGVKFRNDRAPYMVRPMFCLSPQSNYQEVRLMFPAQTGKSTVGEQATLYYIQEVPSEILYVSSDDNASRKWMEKRIVPRAEKLGIQFRAQTEDRSAKRTGNTIRAKEFDGGNIDAASSRSPAQLASETKRFVNADETDRWKQTLGAEGFTWDIMYARTQAWGNQKKILATSTPTTFDDSLIWPLFEEGTREEYFVPCPHCGHMQILVIERLKYELKKNKVWYECESCNKEIHESKKHWFLNNGEWRAQAEAINDSIVSFHINAIYSPFKEWIEIAREYDKALGDPMRMHTFTNLVLGMPYRETGSRPKIEKVIELRSDYRSRVVPNEVLYITAGADVQRGKDKYRDLSDEDLELEIKELERQGKNIWTSGIPRIECFVLGHGEGYRTFGIEYKVFYGSTQSINKGAFLKVDQWIKETGLEYTHVDGAKKAVSKFLIDSGYNTDIVYDFCEQYPGFIPCKGDSDKGEATDQVKGDQQSKTTWYPYKLSQIRETQKLAIISTNHYKRKIYSNLKLDRIQGKQTPPRFMEFPRDFPDHFFGMLTNAELRTDGSFHDGSRPVEALDCFDDITEVLTSKGWKLFNNLSGKEKLATVNMKTENIEYQYPTHYIKNKHDGDMISLKTRRMDILVTPKHRMVVKEQVERNKKFILSSPKIVLAKDLSRRHCIMMSANWGKKYNKKIKIAPYISKQGVEIWPEVYVDKKDFASFMGWFVSEGHSFKYSIGSSVRKRICIDQKKANTVLIIDDLLYRLPWGFKKVEKNGCFSYIFTNAQLYREAIKCGIGVSNKKVPRWIKESSKDVISSFLDAAILGDGWTQTKNGQRNHRTYSTISKQLADDIQELMIKNGTAANIKEVNHKIIYSGGSLSIGKDNLFTVSKKQYHISECKSKIASLDGKKESGERGYIGKTVYYKGFVYCASVPNGTLILRRNGKSFISGNCTVYALCAGDICMDDWVKGHREVLVKKGVPRKQAEKLFTHRMMIDRLKLARFGKSE